MEYSMDDWERMQREAERRVKLSKEQNKRRVTGEHSIPVPDFIKSGENDRHDRNEQVPKSPARQKSNGIFDLLNFNNFDIDSDRSLVLIMLALLNGEEKDELLTLALLYIML